MQYRESRTVRTQRRCTRKVHIEEFLNESHVQESVPQPQSEIVLNMEKFIPASPQKKAKKRPYLVEAVPACWPGSGSFNDTVST